jgi:hypothetical protein
MAMEARKQQLRRVDLILQRRYGSMIITSQGFLAWCTTLKDGRLAI